MKICLVKRDKPVLEPAYPSDLKIVQRLRPNIVKSVDLTQPRNYEFHKKLFAIAKLVVDNVPEGHIWEGKSPYLLVKALMYEIGMVDIYQNIDGSVRLETKSLAFDAMCHSEFAEVYKKVVTICANILGCTFEQLNERQKNLEL